MFKIKTLLSLALLTGLASHAQYTDAINSNRPGKSQSAFSVGKTVLQAESGIYGIQEKHNLLGTETNGFGLDLNLRYGCFLEQLEFNLELQYQSDQYKTVLGIEKKNALKQTIIGAKYLLYDPNKNYEAKVNIYSWKANHRFKWREFIPAVSAYAGFNLNFNGAYSYKGEPKVSPKIAIITQNQFSGGYVFVINLIADKISSDDHSYGYVVTLTKGINEKWSAFVENQSFKSDLYADVLLRGGAAYLIKENMQLDASITSNFKDTPSVFYGGIGFSWRFDKNYKPVLLRDKKDKDKDKKDKDKKDKKKRKDEVETTPTKP